MHVYVNQKFSRTTTEKKYIFKKEIATKGIKNSTYCHAGRGGMEKLVSRKTR